MPPLMNLPAYEVRNALVDFSPITNAIDSNRQNALAQRRMDMEGERLGMERTRLGMAERSAADAREEAVKRRIGGMALMALQDADEGKRSEALNQILAMHPNQASLGPHYRDPRTGLHAILSDAGMADDYLKLRLDQRRTDAQVANVGQTDDIREYNFARSKGGFQGSFEDWMKVKSAGALKYGLNPVPYQKPDGSIGYMVPNTQGEARDLNIPGGGTAMPKATTIQTPTQIITQDQFGNELRRENKDIAGKEAQEEVGKAQGKAQVDLPRIEENATRALSTIEAIRQHPGKQYGVGAQGVLPGIPGTRQGGFVQLVEQAKGQAFIEAFNSLRGGGQITEVEGAKATQSIARLNRAQTMQDFDAALKDLEDVIKVGMARARRSATPVPSQAPPPTKLPQGWSFERVE